MSAQSAHRKHLLKAGAIAGIIGLFLLLRLIAPPELVRDPQAVLTNWATQWGWIGIAGYVIISSVLTAVGVPPALFMAPIGLLWKTPLALSMAGVIGLAGSVLGFWGGRYIAREFFTMRIPPKLQAFEHRLEEHGLSTVIVLRLLFFLFPPVNWLIGVSQIRFRVFVIGTIIGGLPGTLFFTLTGTGLIDWLLGQSIGVVLTIGLVTLITSACWLHFITHDPPPSADDTG